jgi:ApaG protein
MVTATTNGIRISVETFYQAEMSQPLRREHLFAYRITIVNDSPYAVQLLHRHWTISDGNGEQRTVQGEGVVGQQPVLEAGGLYQYVSGVPIKSEIGAMYGYYTMQRQADSAIFEAQIPKFTLVVPSKNN